MSDSKFLVEKDKIRGVVPGETGKVDEVYATYLDGINVGTDPELHIALAASSDARFRTFLELLSKPGKKYLKHSTLAKRCGIDLLEFSQFYSKASTQMAIARAQKRAAGIVDDMAVDAASRSEFCERCDGLGWVNALDNLPIETPGYRIMGMKTVPGNPEKGVPDREEPIWSRTCPKCKGATTIRTPGDEHSRDKVLEIAGLINKGGKGGAAVQIVQNFSGASHSSAVTGSLDQLTVDVDCEEILDGEG